MRARRARADLMSFASTVKVRNLVLISPLFPRSSCVLSISVYSALILSKSSFCGAIVILFLKSSLFAWRLIRESCTLTDRSVKRVIHIAKGFKNGGLVVRLRKLIVNIFKLNALGIPPVCKAANSSNSMHLEYRPFARRQIPSLYIRSNGMLSCAVWGFPSPFACRIRVSICFLSCRESLRFSFWVFFFSFDNRPYLLI